MYKLFLKRFFDFFAALFLLVLLLPIFTVVAILVRLKHGSPVLFRQMRPGRNEKIFTMYKFRTMSNKVDENGALLPDGDRLTKLGKFLRSTSLDELPELFNILKGEMSFVGPRPLLVKYLPLYNETQRRRHIVRPGLTGLAQVKGRNAISWNEKFKYDIEYIEKLSLVKDIHILLLTVLIVLRKEGVSSDTSATMEEFKGDN